jgi:hypothetical protein
MTGEERKGKRIKEEVRETEPGGGGEEEEEEG